MRRRGTDGSTERRKAGPRATRKDGSERWVETVFFGLAEVVTFGFPTLLALLDAPFNAELKFAALVAVTTLSLAIGTARWSESFDWPPLSYGTALVRIVYHSLAIALAAVGGAAIDVLAGSTLGSLAVAALLSIGAIRLFPRLIAALDRLPPWWQWGQ
ncbi:hypothetical protein C448_09497 [Halococcus morrhuae DSM 1307]|uniref:DUF8215 domain-containing protein n=1 Tax=Halococcus morrhuae DSM 1307 TaxID=931277 RepID=M0MDF8_HALMO|nr:hypothetical protein [Halococcus morrhuae]EMA43802.1 hypothetical protein C448_09497 [Halococcus morrhuae DSM 1307]